MAEKSIIIIGAGLAGLSAGCYAQMNGYRSRIFEHHAVPGGVAATWKRGGYTIDGGIHFIMGHKPGSALYEVYRQLGAAPGHFVDMSGYGRFIDETSERSVDVTGDLCRLAADLKAFSPADAGEIDDLIAGARAMRGIDLNDAGMSKPPELMGPLDWLKELWQMRRLFKYFTGKYAGSVEDYASGIRDPGLRECVRRLFAPDVPVWFIFMILGMLADGQLGFLAAGSLDFALSIERRYRDLGGQVAYKATVEEILVEDDRAVGVRLADGSEHRAGAVVSAADGYGTIFEMLGGRYVNRKIRSRYSSWELCRPLLMISYGVARELPGELPFGAILLEDPLTIDDKPVEGLLARIFNYSSRFAPLGKTVVQVEIETEWDYWSGLRARDRAAYDAQKERVATEALMRLEVHYPGISSQVEVTDVATPHTTWRHTLNHRGAWGGWLLTPEVANVRMERTLPGLAGFYMAGQWVMPGGGVAPSLYSGRHAVQLLCRRDGKRFVTMA